MSNLDKWEKLFKRKGWAYKRVKTKWQESLMIKTGYQLKKCHIFVSETKVNFACFTGGGPNFNKDAVRNGQTTFCMSFRNGSLHVYAKDRFHKGQIALFGVKDEEGEIKYNIEINKGNVVQFMKNRNQYVEKEVADKYIEVFKQHKLVGGN